MKKIFNISTYLAVIHFILCMMRSKSFFVQESVYLMICRSIFLVILVSIYNIIYIWIKQKNITMKRLFPFFCVYFGVMLVLLFLIYPGNWRGGDEFHILKYVQYGEVNFWHHYLTYLFYTLSIFMLPFPAGIVIMQTLVIALIVGYICSFINIYFSKKLSIIAFLLFFLPPILDSNFYPMRMSLYAFIECLLWIYIIKIKKENVINNNIIINLSVLTSILAVWRTEGIIYIITIPIIYILLFRKSYSSAKIIGYMFIIFICLLMPQSIGNRIQNSNSEYKFTAIMNQIIPLIVEEQKYNPESVDLKNINQVMSIAAINEGGKKFNWDANKIYWNQSELSENLIRNNYTKKEYNKFLFSYVRLICKYPKIFLKERITVFLDSMPGVTLSSVPDIYNSSDSKHIYFANNYPLNKPVFPNLRLQVINILRCGNLPENVRSFIWNVGIPMMIMCIMSIVLFIKKEWIYIVISAVILLRFTLVFLTAPASYFMYYYSIYLVSLIISIVTIYQCKRKLS